MKLLTFVNGTQNGNDKLSGEQTAYFGFVELRAAIYEKDSGLQYLELSYVQTDNASTGKIQSRLYRNPRYINNLFKAAKMIGELGSLRDLENTLYEIGVTDKQCSHFLICLRNAIYSEDNIPELVKLDADERFSFRMFEDMLTDPVITAGFNAFISEKDERLDKFLAFAAHETASRMETKTYHDFIDTFREVVGGYVKTAVDRVVKHGVAGIDPNLNDFKIASAAYEATRVKHVPTPPERKSGFKRHGDKGYAVKRDRNDVTVPKEYGLKEEHELTHDERLALGVLEKMFGKGVARAMIRGKELGFIKAKEATVVDLDVEVEYELTVIINLSK